MSSPSRTFLPSGARQPAHSAAVPPDPLGHLDAGTQVLLAKEAKTSPSTGQALPPSGSHPSTQGSSRHRRREAS